MEKFFILSGIDSCLVPVKTWKWKNYDLIYLILGIIGVKKVL